MPAHITVVYPFLNESRLTGDVPAQLRRLCGQHDALEITFVRTARFPRVLYLDPEPADGLRALTQAIADRWPEAPPTLDEARLYVFDGARWKVLARLPFQGDG